MLNITRPHQYLVTWVDPHGKSNSRFTKQTNFKADGLSGVYGGFKLFLTVCFAYIPNKSADNCIFGDVLMPEGIPIRGPHLKKSTRISDDEVKI